MTKDKISEESSLGYASKIDFKRFVLTSKIFMVFNTQDIEEIQFFYYLKIYTRNTS